MSVERIVVMTSGGDAPGMNAAVRATARIGAYYGIEVLGARRGYQGFIDDDFVPLGPRAVSNIIQAGGTMLHTARCEEFRTVERREKAVANLRARGVGGAVLIGGDGTFAGAIELEKMWDGLIVGVPGTIDNDLYGSDFTIGFDTAVNTAVEAIDKIRDTADAHERLFLVEVMGRRAGFIALAVGVGGGAEEILIPETPTDLDEIERRLRANRARGKRSNLIVVAEGDEAGDAADIAARLDEQGLDSRTVVLGHLQRGGRPTASDRVLATRLGAHAVEALREGVSGVMVGIVAGEVRLTPLQDAISKRKPVNQDLVRLTRMLAT